MCQVSVTDPTSPVQEEKELDLGEENEAEPDPEKLDEREAYFRGGEPGLLECRVTRDREFLLLSNFPPGELDMRAVCR